MTRKKYSAFWSVRCAVKLNILEKPTLSSNIDLIIKNVNAEELSEKKIKKFPRSFTTTIIASMLMQVPMTRILFFWTMQDAEIVEREENVLATPKKLFLFIKPEWEKGLHVLAYFFMKVRHPFF